MTIDQIFENTKLAHEMGIKTIVLQSGEDPYYTVDKLAYLLRKIKSELQMAITLSIGEKTFKEYEILKSAGADRYLLKFETSDRELYKLIKPDSDFSARFECLKYLKELGYQVGSGNIVGLPGQTPEILLKDILTFDKLNLDMIGIGPFIPHPNTPFGDENPGSVIETLKVLALTRIITKNSHLPATTALATVDPMGREKALCAGANVLMPNVGLQSYKRYYQIYPNKISIFESSEEVFLKVRKMFRMLRRKISKTYGDSLKI
jgi:biotin synthase